MDLVLGEGMWIITPKQMIAKHYEWESERVPRVPFPTLYISKCLFTLYLLLFIVAFFMYHIFIIISFAAAFYFLFSYYLFIRLWKLAGLSVWKHNLFFVITGFFVVAIAVYIRGEILSYLSMLGW